MRFIKSDSIKIQVAKEQENQISSKERISKACQKGECIAFDIYNDENLIGFAAIKEYEKEEFFLWNFAIDLKYQNMHYGTISLNELISYLICNYSMKTMTTTYIYGNSHAKHLYEKAGFVETDTVDEEGCHEVNMILNIK